MQQPEPTRYFNLDTRALPWAAWIAIALLCAMGGLSACTTTPLVGTASTQEATPVPVLEPAQRWSGRMALSSTIEQQSFSADFVLQGQPDRGELSLHTAWGTTLARLQWQPDMARLEQNGQVHHASGLDVLLRDLGLDAVPLATLFDWLQGRPTSAVGWQVDLGARAQGRIVAQRLSPLPPATLRIVLESDF